MAFWRWATMDSCNPFSTRFWHWGNLFGNSRFEQVQRLKQEKLVDLLNQVEFNHPANANSQIICPLTNKPIVEPVITIEGVVYEKYALLRRIKAYYDVPGSNIFLTREDVYDFTELLGVLQFAKYRKAHYESELQHWLLKLNQAITNVKHSLSHPSIFICPLSKRKIKSAVITGEGRVYDEEAIKGYFESTGNDFDPIDGTPLSIDSIIPFHRFNESICYYKNYVAESADNFSKVVDKALDAVVLGIDFAQSFFSAPQYIEEDGALMQKPGMNFKLT